MGPSWLHAEPLDVVGLLWAAGLGGLVLADGLRVWVVRWWRARHAEDWFERVLVWWRGEMSPRWPRWWAPVCSLAVWWW